MFSNECFLAILRVVPGFLEIIARFCYDIAMHAINILGALL